MITIQSWRGNEGKIIKYAVSRGWRIEEKMIKKPTIVAYFYL